MNDAAAVPAPTALSRWRARIAHAQPAWRDEIEALAAAAIDRAVLVALLARERDAADWRDEAHLRAALRRVRAKTMAALIDRDLTRRADLA